MPRSRTVFLGRVEWPILYVSRLAPRLLLIRLLQGCRRVPARLCSLFDHNYTRHSVLACHVDTMDQLYDCSATLVSICAFLIAICTILVSLRMYV